MSVTGDDGSPLLPRSAPQPFHLLAKPTGAVCNLDCTYCFFLSKEMLYPGSRFRMADELLDTYLRQLIEAHGGAPEVVVAWQGGEPTMMGLDFFRRAVELANGTGGPASRSPTPSRPTARCWTTSGARSSPSTASWSACRSTARSEVHDTYRVDKGGKGSFDRVMKGLAALQRHDVAWNALTTVHAANAGLGREVYAFLRDDCGARFMQFIPIVERATPETLAAANAGWGARVRDRPLYVQEGNLVTGRSVAADGYGRFLIDVFEDWVRRDIGEVYVQMFDVALANWYGEPPGLCVHSETCGLALALEHTGDVYSCDHYVEPALPAGQYPRDPPGRPGRSRPGSRSSARPSGTRCRATAGTCDVRFACHGGCPKDRFMTTPDGEPGLHYLCPSYQAFFRHVRPAMDEMCELLKAGRAPSELAGRYAAADSRRGRNDPCPCGSGRKWKRCHLLPPAPRLAGAAAGAPAGPGPPG